MVACVLITLRKLEGNHAEKKGDSTIEIDGVVYNNTEEAVPVEPDRWVEYK